MADLDDAETFFLDVIHGRKKGLRATGLRLLFSVLSRVYESVIRLRLRGYHQRLFRDHTPGCLVISIGNLTMGGTGKTPVVEMLARELQAGGRKVAILSRGYKSKVVKRKQMLRQLADPMKPESLVFFPLPRVVSDGKKVLMDSRTGGDEPVMLARNLRGVPVVVDKDRVKAGLYAIREFGVNTLILDDGLQYLRLRRSLDIVLVDSNAPFGNGCMIPRGDLREPRKSLRRAHFIFLTKCDGTDKSDLIRRLRRYNRAAEIIECTHAPLYLENIVTHERLPLNALEGQHIASMSGIAVPESFEKLLTQAGAIVEITRRFTDHHRFTFKEINQFMDRCEQRDLAMIVTTEKDYVRLPSLQNASVPIFFLRVEIRILQGSAAFNALLKQLCAPRRLVAPLIPE